MPEGAMTPASDREPTITEADRKAADTWLSTVWNGEYNEADVLSLAGLLAAHREAAEDVLINAHAESHGALSAELADASERAQAFERALTTICSSPKDEQHAAVGRDGPCLCNWHIARRALKRFEGNPEEPGQ